MNAIVLGEGRNFVHYEVFGRGPPVIFLHGWLGSWRYWMETMEEIVAKRFRTYAFDFWGFGDSGKRDSYSITLYVSQLRSFIDELGIAGPTMLVGHALGGVVALEFAAQYPNAVSKLALVCLPITAEARDRVLGFFGNSLLARWRRSRFLYPEVAREIAGTDVAAVKASLGSEILSLSKDGAAAGLLTSGENRPTFVVYGERDKLIGTPPLAESYSVFENGSLQVIHFPASGHLPMLDAPAVFNRLLAEFLLGKDPSDLTLKEFWRRPLR